ncbi:MAG: DUF2491 family protein [Burkholderiaceae bacterium]|nr:DUF2491 family protein [Burkholderiaceae bacterium]
MSWNNATSYVRDIVNKRAAKHGLYESQSNEDRDLPLGVRIGALVTLQKAPFIEAALNGSLITEPEGNALPIRAVSRVHLNLSGKLYRYFLHTGDDDEQQTYLQVLLDAHGNVTEVLYCTQLTRIVPESAEDQDAYMGLSGAGLGDSTYTLWRAQLAELGAAEADLAAAFGTSDQLVYSRDAGDPAQAFVAPFTGHETRIDDAAGEHGLAQRLHFMPYARKMGSGREYLLIATEIVDSRDGDASRRAIHVDFTIAIPLDVNRISIQ